MGLSPKDGRLPGVSESEAGERLDRWLVGRGLGLSRAQAQRLIQAGRVTVNGSPALKRQILRAGDRVDLRPPAPDERKRESPPPLPAVLYEDDWVLVVNKPPGMVVHPARAGETGTLVAALRAHTDRLSTAGGADRPGIVHRLDKGTSGLLVVARTDEAYRALVRQFKARTVEKIYRAVVWGALPCRAGSVSAPLGRHRRDRKRMSVRCEGGREADTDYEVEEALPFVSVVRLKPGSGRTHQLRVHLAYLGHPIFGDPDYGGRRVPGRVSSREREMLGRLLALCPRQALHAEVLAFDHPADGRRVRLTADLPDDMARLIAELRGR
jgi:23S rRNA pseudouridine1911/1915/1917 synthase